MLVSDGHLQSWEGIFIFFLNVGLLAERLVLTGLNIVIDLSFRDCLLFQDCSHFLRILAIIKKVGCIRLAFPHQLLVLILEVEKGKFMVHDVKKDENIRYQFES